MLIHNNYNVSHYTKHIIAVNTIPEFVNEFSNPIRQKEIICM